MKRLFLLLLVFVLIGLNADPTEPWRVSAVAIADDGDGGDGNGGDSDGGDGDAGESDGGDGDSGDSDGGEGDGGESDGGERDGGESDGGDSDGADGDDGDDSDDSDGEFSTSPPGSSAEQNGTRSDVEADGDLISDLLDLILGSDRTVVPSEILVLTPAGQTPPDLAALQAAGFAVLEDNALAGLQARLLRLSTPPGADLEQAAQTVQSLSPGSVVDLNDLYEGAGSGCGDDCWGATLVAIDGKAGRSCRRGAPIAMIDTGVRRSHPSLRRARIDAKSFLRPGATAAPVEHGTAIAALLVGETTPGTTPLAPQARLLAAEVMHLEEDRQRADAFALVEALDWTVAARARVIALSLVGQRNAALQFAVQRASRRANLLAAAGNGGARGKPAYPAAYPEVTAVAAVDARLRPYRSGTRGAYVEVAAPGVAIPSASADGRTGTFTGTSFAVSFAVAAMLRARARTGGDPDAARQLLSGTARDLGAPGRDDVYGYGLIQSPGKNCV